MKRQQRHNDPEEIEDENEEDTGDIDSEDEDEDTEEESKPVKNKKAKGLRTQWQQAQDRLEGQMENLLEEITELKKIKTPQVVPPKLPENLTSEGLQQILQQNTAHTIAAVKEAFGIAEKEPNGEADRGGVKTNPKKETNKPFMYKKR